MCVCGRGQIHTRHSEQETQIVQLSKEIVEFEFVGRVLKTRAL